MMNRKEFQQYLADNVRDYLPNSYADAEVTFNEVIKNNDTHLTGISIKRADDVVVPNIYIENFWQEYQAGKDIDHIVGDIADMRIEYETPIVGKDIAARIADYEAVKGNLQIRLCDTKENQDRLADLVHTEHSDFSAIYYVNLQENAEGTASTPVTQQLMGIWGISVEQLHADALAADSQRGPILCEMGEMLESMFFGSEPANLLEHVEDANPAMGMFCLTNGDKAFGAGMILQEDIMAQIGEATGGNFYILPSSTHEVLIVPESTGMEVKELSAMVYEINRTEVEPQDRLSDQVQHYDAGTRVMENAEKRESRLEMEKAEKTAARSRRSIHDRLGEKKQQSAAQKAEKAADKGAKKDKGQEL